MFTVIYILNSSGNDLYADMTLVSVVSMKMANPFLQVHIYTDENTYQAIRDSKHRLFKLADRIRPIITPDGTPTFKNRFIKTQLPQLVESGSYLYVDSDILVRKEIGDMFSSAPDFAAVPNHNQKTIDGQVWHEDLQFIRDMNWSDPVAPYFNGGVFFFTKNEQSKNAFLLWHRFWMQGINEKSRYQDQPALNKAIHESAIQFVILPDQINRQVSVLDHDFEDTIIWHYYWSGVRRKVGLRDKNTFTILVNLAQDLPLFLIKKLIRIAISSTSPRLNQWWIMGIRLINLKNKLKSFITGKA